MQGINIYSGEKGLGAALTNPTELARKKGSILESYPIEYAARRWPDVESAYHALKTADAAQNDELMIELIDAKLRQHPSLKLEIKNRGGEAFLRSCSHLTGAKSESAISWEGYGLKSRFIRNLVAGYVRSESDTRTEQGQNLLF